MHTGCRNQPNAAPRREWAALDVHVPSSHCHYMPSSTRRPRNRPQHDRQQTNATEHPIFDIITHGRRLPRSAPFHSSVPINVENGCPYASGISFRYRIPFPRGTDRRHCSSRRLLPQRLLSLRDMVLARRTRWYSSVNSNSLPADFQYGTRHPQSATPRALARHLVMSGHAFSVQTSTNESQLETNGGLSQAISRGSLTLD